MTATQSPAVVPADPTTAGHMSRQVELPGGGEAVPGGRGEATAGTAALVAVDLHALAARFWPKVAIGAPRDCWHWRAYVDLSGYGRFGVGGRSGGMIGAHRVAVLLTTGTLPPRGFDVDHLCRNTRCVNPAHLEVVTHQENNRRGIAGAVNAARQRAITHCPAGHAYDEANTAYRRDGRRRCKACDQARTRRYYNADPERACAQARRSRARRGVS